MGIRWKRNLYNAAVTVLTVTLLLAFMLPVQAFAETVEDGSEGGTPAVVSDDGSNTGTNTDSNSGTNTDTNTATDTATDTGSAYLIPGLPTTSGTEGSGTEGTGTEESGTQGSGTEGNGTEGSGTQGSGTQGSGTQGSGTQGSGTQGSGTEGSGTQGSGTEGNGTKGSGNEEVSTQDTGTTEINSEWTKFINNDNDNAIQQAVDAAIAAGQKYITIVVQDGTYTGGLLIDNSGVDENGNEKESIVVNIVAHDAYNHNSSQEDTTASQNTANSSTNTGATDNSGDEAAPAPNAVYPVPTITDASGNTVVDTSVIHSDSAGGVKLEGGVSVKNVELLLAGIYLSMKENQGKVEAALGVKESVDVKVENADQFTYYGTSQGDKVNVILTDVDNADIQSGNGDDTVSTEIHFTPTVDYNSATADTGSSSVNILSGSGNDTITVTQQSAATQKDNTVYIYNKNTSLLVDAGTGADTIHLKGDTGLIDIEQELAEAVKNIAQTKLASVTNTATICGGEGDDLLNLDTSWELGSFGKTSVSYEGGNGNDRLHFTGGLDPAHAATQDKITVSEDGSVVSMHTSSTVTKTEYSVVNTNLWVNKSVTELTLPGFLAVSKSGVEALTDALTGKDTVYATQGTDGKLYNGNQMITEFRPFTNYVLDLSETGGVIGKVDYSDFNTVGQYMTNVIIRGQHLTLEEGTAIILPGITLLLESRDGSYESGSITIAGSIIADNILLKLTSTDSHEITIFGREEEDVTPGTGTTTGEGNAAAEDSGIDLDASIMDVVSSVSVVIANTARLMANKVVDILAQSLQTKGLIPDLTDLVPGFEKLEEAEKNIILKKVFGLEALEQIKEASNLSFVSIKLSNAIVNILGSIEAAAVRVSALSKVETSATNSALRDFGMPFAVGVVLGEAGVVVGENARIQATDSVNLKAESEIKMQTTSRSGRLPFTLAVSVVDNKAYVEIRDNAQLISATGDIILDAKGNVQVITAATGSNTMPNNNVVVPSTDHEASNTTTQLDKGKSGGFFAISVVTQNVFAALKDAAGAAFAKALEVNSTANASVSNQAVSNPAEGGDSMTLAELIKLLTGSGDDKTGEADSEKKYGGLLGSLIRKIRDKRNAPAPDDGTVTEEEKRDNARKEAEEKKKSDTIGNLIDKLQGKSGNKEDDDSVGSLVDKATTSANTGNTDSTHTVQLVGSLAVTYASNDNRAYIDTTGNVVEFTAQGVQPAGENSIKVIANGSLKVETLADGSPVNRNDAGAADQNGNKKDGPEDVHYAAHSHGAVKVDKLTNGTILVDYVVGGSDGSLEMDKKGDFPEGVNIYDTVSFVIKAAFGYKLSQNDNGEYIITNKYKNVMDGSDQTETFAVDYVGKDADGNLIYKGNYKFHSNNNVLSAQFVPNGHKITANVEAPQMGTIEFCDAAEEGNKLYFADKDKFVYVKINVKSGVSIGDQLGFDGGSLTFVKSENNEDGTKTLYYSFTMPDSDVVINVPFVGNSMTVNVDSAPGGQVWIHNAGTETTGNAVTSYSGKVGEKVKIVIQLGKGTYLAANSLMFAGKTPVYIKSIEDQGNGQYVAYVNLPAVLKTEGSAAADNVLNLTYKTTTNAKQAQQTIENRGTALGAGLAVDVTRYNNQAYIAVGNRNLQAKSITVRANTSDLSASATSKAGFVAADLGVAGAITVHLVSANNEALITGNDEDVIFDSARKIILTGGDLVVDSVVNNSNIVTNAQAAGDGANSDPAKLDPDSVGVGAGIAVGVTNLVVHAKIQDAIKIDGTMGGMNINAGHTGTEFMAASAGASGGTSAVPVLALNVSGVSVLADSGKMLNNLLTLTGDAVVSAANSITRTITADASAVGSGVGVGASFIIDILNDSAKAKLGRSVNTTGNITVSADSVSRLNATAKSGAKGSVSQKGGSKPAGDTGNDSGKSGEEPPPSGAKNKKDELPDDYYAGLDDLFNEPSGSDSDVDEDPESLAPLFSEGEADAFVDKNKDSATGLAGLVDIKDKKDPSKSSGNVNAANVGNAFENRQKAETSEGNVQVAATMVLNIQNNEALAQIDAVSSIHAGGTVKVTSRHDTDGVIMANASATNSDTGVGVAVAINTVTYTNIAQILSSQIRAAEVVVRADIYEAEAEQTAKGFFEAIQADVLGTADSLKNFVDEIMKAAGKGTLVEFIRDYVGKLVVSNSVDAEGVAQLIIQWIGELIQGKTPSFPTAEQEDAVKKQVTEYAKKVFSEVKKNFSVKKLMSLTLGSGGLWGKISSGFKNGMKSIKDFNLKQSATDALIGYLAGKLGGNEEAEGMGPRISTSAVSGAGATNVGVAGSVAISVVNGTSNAYIAEANNGSMTVTGNITVQSMAGQDVYTSAGASVDALGRVEKNKASTDTANSTQGGASNADSGKSVGVGAAVALSFADLISDAGIGSGWTITAMDLLMESKAQNNVETTSVSGTDPLARSQDPSDKTDQMLTEEQKKEKEKAEAEKKAAAAMNYAVDASVAVTLIQNKVKAYLAENSVITLGGKLNMLSAQSGETYTNASGFAMGTDTAVGAAVAINLAFSDVLTSFAGSGSVVGNAVLDSTTENQDDANALALAMGAEMDRYFAKIRNAEKVTAHNQKQDTPDVEHPDDTRVRIENETSKKLSNQLKRASKVSDPQQKNQDKSNPAQPLSVQALKSQNVKTESTNQTDSDKNNSVGNTVANAANGNSGTAVSGTLNTQAQEGQSIHVAAAVGVNVTQHDAKTEIKGNLSAGGIKADVTNTSNFGAVATGAAISEAKNSNTVGVAVAVTVNGNQARIEIPDEITLTITADPATGTIGDSILGNVALRTALNQNSTGDAQAKYGALAVAGSSSGKGGKVGLAGSVAVVVAKGTSAIILGKDVTINGRNGSVSLESSDKSKLSAAAMAATISDGSTAGVGASFALLYAQNEVIAGAGDNLTVNAKAFNMTATKKDVDITDFSIDASLSDYITVLTVDADGNGGYKKEDAHKYGMIVLQKNQNGTYNIFTNFKTENIMDLLQWSSVLASVNYYASAVAGTVMERKGDTSGQKAAVAGSVSMLFNDSVTRASIGTNARITTTNATEIKASSETNTRLLGGALSSSGAKAGIGLNVATVKQNDKVYAQVGNNAVINADSFRIQSKSVSDMLVITAAAVNASGTSVGGTLNVVINDTGANAQVGDNAHITSGSFVEILADADSNVVLGSLTVSISGSTNQGASVGAIVSVASNASEAKAALGKGAKVNAGSIIRVRAANQEQVISVLAAVARSGNGGAGAGTVSVLTTDAMTIAVVGDGANLTAGDDIEIDALGKAMLVDLMLAAAASTDAPAVGATIMVNVFNRETGAYIGNNCVILSKNGNVRVMAESLENAYIISVAGAAASENALSGNIQVNVGTSKVYATIGDNANIKAWDSICVTADQESNVIAISPTVTYGSNSTAVGATVQTNILSGEVKAAIGKNADLTAYAQSSTTNGIYTANRESRRKGVILSALMRDLVVAGGVSASAGKNAVAGVVETMVNKTVVLANLGANSVVRVGFQSGDTMDGAFEGNTPSEKEGELSADADAHSTLVLFGGAFSATSGTGLGATVLTLVYDKNVNSQLLLSTDKPSYVNGKVTVNAKTEDLVALLSVNFGVSSDTAANAGGNVLIFQNQVDAKLSGDLTATGDVTVQADNITDIINGIASFSGALGGNAVSGAALVTYFQGKTTASVGDASRISSKDLKVLATSTANIHSDGVGITASVGSAAVSGLVNVIVTTTETRAFIGSGSVVKAENVHVTATDNYDLLAVAVSLSGGSNGIGVTAVVTVAKNTVLAYIADNTAVSCAALNVKALSNRNIRNYAGSVAAGATAGAGVTVMISVIGGKLDMDSANGIGKGFKADQFLSGFKKSVPNAAKNYVDDVNLSKDLEVEEDSKASDLNVGDENGNYSGTDDYRNDDFDQNYTPGSNPGENFSDEVTNTDGSELGMAKPTGDSQNVIKAYIGSDCQITVTGATLVEANEKLNVDIVTASASVGGTAGVNVGVAVVVAYSNVCSEIESRTTLSCGDITVHAISGGDGSISHDKASEVLGAAGIDADASGSSIRVIAITVGIGGTAGVSPSVAVLNMASKSIARMDGVRGQGNVITVKAETVYPRVLAVTGAVGIGGSAGLSASVAVVTFNSDTCAEIINSGMITAQKLNVLSNVNNTAKAYAMSLAAGTVGVNGGVAVVTNRSNTNTLLVIGTYSISGDVAVGASVNTSAESFIVGISLGAVAVGLNAAVVNQHAVVNTRILGDIYSSLSAAGNVSVSNDVTATAKSSVIAVTGGGVGIGGNVLLVFNNMDSTAAMVKMPFTVGGNVTISAGMEADSEANLASATIGGIAVGLSTSYVGLNARNLAYLELAEKMTGSASAIQVLAGTANKPNGFDATATTVAGGIAGVSVGLNAAVADINASNEAKVLSRGTISGKVEVQANAAAEALAEIYFASEGFVTASAATAVSLLRIRQTAEADITTLDNCGEFSTLAFLNDNSDFLPSYAKLVTVSGGVYNASANVAVAYSLSRNIARAILGSAATDGYINIKANGNAAAKSETLNQTASAFSGSVYVNVAYAMGQFQSIFRILKEVSAYSATVETVYITSAQANLTPSASLLNLSIAKFNVNLAIAKAAANALTALEGGGKLAVRNGLSVKADSNGSQTHANITGATVEADAVSFAVNVADSQLALEQTVSIDHITVESNDSIISIYGYADNMSATAQTGANGGKGAGFSIVGGKSNSATASASVINQIILNYANISALDNRYGEVYICASGENLSVNAIANELSFQLSGISAAVIATEAKVTRFNNGVFMTGSHISGNRVEVSATAKGTNVDSQSSVPSFSGSLAGTQSVVAAAKILEKLTQVIMNSGSVSTTYSEIFLRVFADANLEAGSAHPSGSFGAITIQDYQFTVDVEKIITEVQVDGKVDSGSNIRLTSEDTITSNITMDSSTIGGFTGISGVVRIHVKNQTAYVKAAGDITAGSDIKIEADAYQQLSANVDIVSTSLISYGYAQTDIILHRNALVDIEGNLVSRKGSISILAQAGQMDYEDIYYPDEPDHAQNYIDKVIYLYLNMELHSLIDTAPNPTGTAKLVSQALVNVAEGSLIQAVDVKNRNGFISIFATSEGSVQVNVYRNVTKLFGTNAAYAVADVNETVKVNIGGAAKTRILGRDVDIYARTNLYVTSICDTYGTTGVGLYSPVATVILCVDLDTIIRSADISAESYMNIGAYAPYIYVLGHCISRKTNAASTYNNPSVTIKGNIYGDVTIDNNTILRAYDLRIRTFRPAEQNADIVTIKRLAESYIFSMKSATDENTVFSTSKAWEHFRKGSWDDFSTEVKFRSGIYNPNNKNENNVYYTGKLIWSAGSLSGATNPSGQTEIYLGSGSTGIYVMLNGTSASVWGGSQDLVTFRDGVFYVDGSKLNRTGSEGAFSVTFDTTHNNYFIERNAVLDCLTLYNNSQYDVQLINVNQPASKPGAYLNIFQNDANADLIFNDGGDFSDGSIYVNMAGGNVILMNGGQINARQIAINGVGSILNEDTDAKQVVITNSGSSGYEGDTSIHIAVRNALNLLLQTTNSRYIIDRIQSGDDLILEIENTLGKQMTVLLGELISGGDASLAVPHNLESADAELVNITGNDITVYAGGKVGTSGKHLRIDSSVNGASGVSVDACGGIWLSEADGDLYIDEIYNDDSADISLRTENGSIYSATQDDGIDIDSLENIHTQMMKYVEESHFVSASHDTIWVVIQYMRDLLRLEADLLNRGDAALASAMKEIDKLHYASSVEHALQIISGELLYYGGSWYQDPEVAAALMNGSIKDDQLTKEFRDEMDRLNTADPDSIGYLGMMMIIWSSSYQRMQEAYQDVLDSVNAMQQDTVNIYTDGNVQIQLQSASGAASVSHAVNTLNILAGGKVTISTAANTVLENVYLECFEKLTLDPIVATGVIDLYAMEGIYAADRRNQVLLEADRIVLWSLFGDMGTTDQALILNTNVLDVLGNFVSLENRKDLFVNMVFALKELHLTVDGDLKALPFLLADLINGLFSNVIDLNVSGNVGEQDNSLNISANELLNIDARNIYMFSDGDVRVGTISADGMVSISTEKGAIVKAAQGTGIWCDTLRLNSFGMIGTKENPLWIHSDSKFISNGGGVQRRLFRAAPVETGLMANSILYGEYIFIIPVTITTVPEPEYPESEIITVASGSGIRVTGTMGKNVVLTVSAASGHVDCPVCRALVQHHEINGRMFVHLNLEGQFEGKLMVEIPVNEELAAYEGKEIVVLLCRDGKVWAVRAKVIKGYVVFCTEELGPILILGDSAHLELSEDESHIILDQQVVPFGGWL